MEKLHNGCALVEVGVNCGSDGPRRSYLPRLIDWSAVSVVPLVDKNDTKIVDVGAGRSGDDGVADDVENRSRVAICQRLTQA